MSQHRQMTSTAAKRKALALDIKRVTEALEWRFEQSPSPCNEQKGITIYIRHHGDYYAVMSLTGGSHVGAFLAHWNTELHSNAKYPDFFSAGSVNQYHRQEATTCAEDFTHFLTMLEVGMQQLNEYVQFGRQLQPGEAA